MSSDEPTPGKQRAVDLKRLQSLIDDEKPFFDYGRFVLTIIAWFGFVGLGIRVLLPKRSFAEYGIGEWIWSLLFLIGIGFGCVLVFRLVVLTRGVVDEVHKQLSEAKSPFRFLSAPATFIAPFAPWGFLLVLLMASLTPAMD